MPKRVLLSAAILALGLAACGGPSAPMPDDDPMMEPAAQADTAALN